MKSSNAALKSSWMTMVLGVAGAFGLAGNALALPSYSGNCAGCHGDVNEAFEITGFSGMANPVGGAGDLKYYSALPGSTVRLTANVTNGTPSYAVALVDTYTNAGLFAAQQRPGQTWTFETAGPDHFYVGPTNANAAHTFDFFVPLTTAAGYYAFTFTTAGYSPVQFWAESESFYVRVVPEVGTLLLMSAGIGALGFVVRKRRKTAA